MRFKVSLVFCALLLTMSPGNRANVLPCSGPFSGSDMEDWLNMGFFPSTLLVRRECDEVFVSLAELATRWGRNPFKSGPPMPPLRAADLAQVIPPCCGV